MALPVRRSTIAVYQMARSKAGMNVERLVLSGVIVTTFLRPSSFC